MRRVTCLLLCVALTGALPAQLPGDPGYQGQQESQPSQRSGQHQRQQLYKQQGTDQEQLLKSQAQQEQQTLPSERYVTTDGGSDEPSNDQPQIEVGELESLPSASLARDDPELSAVPVGQTAPSYADPLLPALDPFLSALDPLLPAIDPLLPALDPLPIYGDAAEQATDDVHDTHDIRAGSASVREIVIANAVSKETLGEDEKQPAVSPITQQMLSQNEEASEIESMATIEETAKPAKEQPTGSDNISPLDAASSDSQMEQKQMNVGDENQERNNAHVSEMEPAEVSSIKSTQMQELSKEEASNSEDNSDYRTEEPEVDKTEMQQPAGVADGGATAIQCDAGSACLKAEDCGNVMSSTEEFCLTAGNVRGICCSSTDKTSSSDSVQPELPSTIAEPSPSIPEPAPTSPEPTPAKSEPTPAKSEPTPAKLELAPAKYKQTPAKPDPTLAKPEPSPAKSEPTPAKSEPTPAKLELAPAKYKQTPAKPDPTLAKPEPSPAKPEPTPAKPEPTPAKPELAPAKYKQTPAKPELTPAKPEATPAKPEPTPAESKPTPAKPEQTPAKHEPTPASLEPTPASLEQTPAKPEPTLAKSELPPASPEPTPAKLEPTPAKLEPTPAKPEPTPAKSKLTHAKPEPTPAKPESPTRISECPDQLECVQRQFCGVDGFVDRSKSSAPAKTSSDIQSCRSQSGELGVCCRAPVKEDTEIVCNFNEECVESVVCGANGFIRTDAEEIEARDPAEKEKLGPYGTFCRLPLGGQGRCCRQPDPEWPSDTPIPSCGHSHHIPLPGDSDKHARETLFGEITWQATIFEKGTNRFICGGAIVSARNILTSEHCIHKYHNSDIFIRVGDYIIHQDSEPLPYQDLEVYSIRAHPSTGALFNDIVVMELIGEIQFDAHVQPICMPELDQDFEGARCVVSGWGKPAFVGNYSERLERIEVPVVNREVCVTNLRDTHLGHFFRLDDSMVCAGGEKDTDACRGDAGGPLACRSVDGSYVLAGVAAWSVGCSRHGVPSVYTSVSRTLAFTAHYITGEEYHPFYRSNGGVTEHY